MSEGCVLNEELSPILVEKNGFFRVTYKKTKHNGIICLSGVVHTEYKSFLHGFSGNNGVICPTNKLKNIVGGEYDKNQGVIKLDMKEYQNHVLFVTYTFKEMHNNINWLKDGF